MEERAPLPTDLAELIDELRGLRESANSERASSERIRAILPRLRSMVRKNMPSKSPLRLGIDSEDLLQESLFQLVRQIDSFRGATWGEFIAFAQAILTQKTAQQARRHQLRRNELGAAQGASEVLSTDPTPSVDASRAEDKMRVQSLVRTLPSKYRRPIEMRLSGHGNDVIAKELGLTDQTLRQRMSRAMTMLKSRW